MEHFVVHGPSGCRLTFQENLGGSQSQGCKCPDLIFGDFASAEGGSVCSWDHEHPGRRCVAQTD